MGGSGTSLIPVSLIVIYCSHNLILYLVGIVSLGFNYKMAMLKIMGTIHNFISNEVRSSVISLVSSLSSVFLIGLQIIIGKILDTKNLFYCRKKLNKKKEEDQFLSLLLREIIIYIH